MIVVHSKSKKHLQLRDETLSCQGKASIVEDFVWQERMIRTLMISCDLFKLNMAYIMAKEELAFTKPY